MVIGEGVWSWEGHGRGGVVMGRGLVMERDCGCLDVWRGSGHGERSGHGEALWLYPPMDLRRVCGRVEGSGHGHGVRVSLFAFSWS